MLVDVSELTRTPGGEEVRRGTLALSAGDLALAEVRAVEPAEARIRLRNVGGALIAEGEASTRVKVPCARCGTEFSLTVEASWETTYRRGPEGSAGTVGIGEDGETEWTFFEGSAIDVTPDVIQALSLALPMKPLCRPYCRGLCPVCGQNLNEGSCSCETQTVDPRWAALQDYARKTKGV